VVEQRSKCTRARVIQVALAFFGTVALIGGLALAGATLSALVVYRWIFAAIPLIIGGGYMIYKSADICDLEDPRVIERLQQEVPTMSYEELEKIGLRELLRKGVVDLDTIHDKFDNWNHRHRYESGHSKAVKDQAYLLVNLGVFLQGDYDDAIR
jgi:hypothetical protein